MSTQDSPASTNKKLELLFGYDDDDRQPTKNVYINTTVPDMFQYEKKISGKLDCRKHYETVGFDRVYITYSHEKGLHIRALNEYETRQELFIPERYIVCVGVDYEPERTE